MHSFEARPNNRPNGLFGFWRLLAHNGKTDLTPKKFKRHRWSRYRTIKDETEITRGKGERLRRFQGSWKASTSYLAQLAAPGVPAHARGEPERPRLFRLQCQGVVRCHTRQKPCRLRASRFVQSIVPERLGSRSDFRPQDISNKDKLAVSRCHDPDRRWA